MELIMFHLADLPLPPSPVGQFPWAIVIIGAVTLAAITLAAVLIFKTVKKNRNSDKDA